MRIINTRPADRAKQLTQSLLQLGYQVIEFPLLELSELPLDQKLSMQYQQLEQADIVVVVSPLAAQIGLQYAKQCGISRDTLLGKQWIAVGRATQASLKRHAIDSTIPDIETSEGMLQLDLLEQGQNKTVAFWRGIGGRTFMMENLLSQGFNIINMLLYQRQMPTYKDSELDRLSGSQEATAILISSEQSFKHWCALPLPQPLFQYTYLVLGERVTDVVFQYFKQYAQKPEIKTLSTLAADAIDEQLKQHR